MTDRRLGGTARISKQATAATVAILTQSTSWAAAITQARLSTQLNCTGDAPRVLQSARMGPRNATRARTMARPAAHAVASHDG